MKSHDRTLTFERIGTNPSGSVVEYQPVAEDMATTGKFWQRWKIVFTGGAIQNFPNDEFNVIEILEKLA